MSMFRVQTYPGGMFIWPAGTHLIHMDEWVRTDVELVGYRAGPRWVVRLGSGRYTLEFVVTRTTGSVSIYRREGHGEYAWYSRERIEEYRLPQDTREFVGAVTRYMCAYGSDPLV